MAQQKPEKVTLSQVLQLANLLSPEEQGELRRKLDQSWGEQWDDLAARILERSSHMPAMTDDEILAEVKAVREQRKAIRAEGSH
ncbi:MAG TPA: hypothetical protein V6C69_12495 [Trichormus sp.]|jgi:hypothetical protein